MVTWADIKLTSMNANCHQNVSFQHCSHLNNQICLINMDISTFGNLSGQHTFLPSIVGLLQLHWAVAHRELIRFFKLLTKCSSIRSPMPSETVHECQTPDRVNELVHHKSRRRREGYWPAPRNCRPPLPTRLHCHFLCQPTLWLGQCHRG